MADVIQLLPESIANQIAAGEVVQRPASVVKELMENAVDAGATSIKLILKEAGKVLIQVTDNGCGMSETDARMCFERHATSKIRRSEDLFCIRTMGFRGEALASIAAVAQVEMRTRQHNKDLGTRILIEASELKVQEPCQSAPGTSIKVSNLFYNVPARRNFLKSNASEMRHILDEFQRIALANTDVFFSLHHNGNEVYHLPPGNLRQRIVNIFGSNINPKLVPVNEETDVTSITGFIGKPDAARKTRGEQLFFVNGRFIKSGYLHHAVMSAYEDLLPKDTYPFYVLFIEIDPARVDINVHPTKQEIKFDDERLVYNYLKVAVRHALGQYSITPSLDFDQVTSFSSTLAGGKPLERQPRVPASDSRPQQGSSGRVSPEGRPQANWQKLFEGLEQFESELNQQEEGTETHAESITLNSEASEENEQATLGEALTKERKLPYQIHGTYIISQIKSGFLLIDQQAAHERILYEQYLEVLESQKAYTQTSLFPKTINLAPADAELMMELMPAAKMLGFDIEEFGQGAFIIHGIPADLAGAVEETKLIEQLLHQYRENLDLELNIKENIARSLARSAAIKRGQQLEPAEMQMLIDKLFACAMPFKSPSGKNCFITFELEELEKRFLKG
ncbi:MAG: DNA mismatch repair protein MutL [Saprospirales bacterium]|nr:DNA mismatch repair protein MutL [Saprospirales bacterium]